MNIRDYFKSGDAWIWLHAGTVTISLVMVFGIVGLLAVRGLGHFWPADIVEAERIMADGSHRMVIGEIRERQAIPAQRLREAGVTVPAGIEQMPRYFLKLGNRDTGSTDFDQVLASELQNIRLPAELVVLERYEWGNFYGRLLRVEVDGKTITGAAAWPVLQDSLARSKSLRQAMRDIEKKPMANIQYRLEKLRLQERKLQLAGGLDAVARKKLAAERQQLDSEYRDMAARLQSLSLALARDTAVFVDAGGHERRQAVGGIVSALQPNSLSTVQKLGIYCRNLWQFLAGEPREANTEGGVFPAIFGTVMMVLLMTVLVTPLGVIAAIYLREYARQNLLTQTLRIAVNNLAGVPSIVYGVFGLGFFVYFLGGSIDRLFYPEVAPAPVFGTPGLLWASATLALLTLPVVIVSTEEGLSRVPRMLREGSQALGATRAETLWRVVLPMATPGIMTGVILAIARAAGEVAPLMLVGVVKLAPALPVDGNAPFVHLERKFMHLGFHIYDVGFQSPNVEAAEPLVYATALLLVVVVAALNLSAVALRNRLREKYRSLES